MKFLSSSLFALSSLAACTFATPVDLSQLGCTRRADPSLVGYLGAFFLGSEPNVYFYRSNGNNAISFVAQNGGSPVIVPTLGTQGVRDPSIISGAGEEAGHKWYIIGTDLNIGKTNWDAAVRNGSRGIFVWESTDLVNWTDERLVTVENSEAGMVWAPDAIWDASKGQYLVHWASKFYEASDTAHSGTPTPIVIRYAHTKDFKTFTEPATWIDNSPASTIDLNILTVNENTYVRFLKNETATYVYTEVSTSGLFGTWTRVPTSTSVISASTEGPASYWDNQVDNKAHLLLDFFTGSGYKPYESTAVENGTWTASDSTNFPTSLRHGSVLPINQTLYDALVAKYG